MTQIYQIVYSLQKIEGLEVIIPSAYICDTDMKGRPGYLQANAHKDTIASYSIEVENTAHLQLMDICHDLSPVNLEKVFNKNKKKQERLSVIFADEKIRIAVQSQIDKKLSRFLDLIKSNQYCLCYQLQRKIKANDVLLHFFDGVAQPKLKFVKSHTGVRYNLHLQVLDEVVIPYKTDIKIISNLPALITIQNLIMSLESINANKIKPFLKEESIFIPEKLIKTFFNQFVTDVMGKLDIEADGFEIIKYSTITKQTIFFLFDIFENKWFAEIRFHYTDFYFNASDKKKRKSRIHFDITENILVFECIRDLDAENQICTILKSIGFQINFNNRFSFGENTMDLFEKISENIEFLKNTFDILLPEIDGNTLQFSKMQLRPNFKLIKDWFDLYGDILIDGEVYPFALLFKNIKNGDRFLKLKNGNFVLIPEEVMTKYSQIATFADANSKDWKLSKSHFTLIENADLVPNKTKLTRIDDNVYAPPASLKAILRPYQIEGVKWLINHRKNGLGACLADDMGLGKTVQVIAALLDAKENKPAGQNSTSFGVQLDLFGEIEILGRKSLNALIVLPASLVFNWHRELLAFAPSLQVIQYTGSQRQKAKDTLHTFDVILTTYQTLILDFEIFKQLHLHYMVLDESQQIRNKNSKTFQIIHQIQADHRISLSGTPIENSLSDLWSQMEFLNGSILGRYSFFKENFLNPIEKKKDASAISTLKKIVEPFILRRTKEQVAKDLPALIEMTHYSTMSEFQTLEYERQKSAARNFLAKLDMHSSQFRFHVLSSILRLRQIANHPILADQDYEGDSGKYNDVQDQIKTLTRSGHKVLVFSSFVSHLKLYAEWLNAENVKYEMLTGSSTTEHRKNAVDLFQSDKNVQVFLISIKAGSTGLNLTAADYIFILDPWWNPFVEKQAVARAHRIGRTHKVIVKRFLSKDTIEEKIVQLQGHKTSLSDDILDVDDIPMLKDVELFKLI